MRHFNLQKVATFGDYEILMNENECNLLFRRTKEYEFPIFAERKILSIGRDTVSSIELNEAADWRTASIIGIGTGIALSITG